MITRKASLLDLARLLDIFPEKDVLEWIQASRNSKIHQTLVTIKSKQLVAGSLSIINPETQVITNLSLFSKQNDPIVLKYIVDKIPLYYKEDGFEPIKILVSGSYSQLDFFKDAGFVPTSFIATKELEGEK